MIFFIDTSITYVRVREGYNLFFVWWICDDFLISGHRCIKYYFTNINFFFTKTLAMELGPAGVRVNAICPGAVEGARMDQVLAMESDFTGRPAAQIEAQYSQGVSLRRFVSPEDIADMAVFLASDAARQITGQAMAVDGHTERMVWALWVLEGTKNE